MRFFVSFCVAYFRAHSKSLDQNRGQFKIILANIVFKNKIQFLLTFVNSFVTQ